MPEVGSLAQRSPTTDASGSEVVGETLIFSSDVIKSDNFNQGDHVILVVPESSEHLVGEEHLVSAETSYVIPSESSIGDDALSPARLRETIKSNFLVIAKLLPSKSPPPLVSITGKVSDESFQADPLEAGSVIERLPDSVKTELKQGSKSPRPPRGPRQSTGKSHPSVKQGKSKSGCGW